MQTQEIKSLTQDQWNEWYNTVDYLLNTLLSYSMAEKLIGEQAKNIDELCKRLLKVD